MGIVALVLLILMVALYIASFFRPQLRMAYDIVVLVSLALLLSGVV